MKITSTLASMVFGCRALRDAAIAQFSKHGTVWFSLSGGGPGSAADLRAIAVAGALRPHGWGGVVLHPRLGTRWRRVLMAVFPPDVVVLQQTRHLLNHPEVYKPVPCVLDADDADIIDSAERERIGEVARKCHGVIVGSRYLGHLFEPYNASRRVIWTGTYLHGEKPLRANSDRGRVLAWAPSDPLGYRSELRFVQELARRLTAEGVELRIYGVRPHQQAEMLAQWRDVLPTNVSLRLMPFMPYVEFVRSLGEVAVGLQPVCEDHEYSLGKSFGKALAYLAADVCVLASNNIDHPLFFHDGENGRLLTNIAEQWATACDELLTTPNQRQKLVSAARNDMSARLTTERSAALLAPLLHLAKEKSPWPRGLASKSS